MNIEIKSFCAEIETFHVLGDTYTDTPLQTSQMLTIGPFYDNHGLDMKYLVF